MSPLIRKSRNPYKELESRLGYKFRKRALIEQALTHRSFKAENPASDNDNQRLEFLGDAVLGFLTAAHLYTHLPGRDEGLMTSLRSRLTNGKILAGLANTLDAGSLLKMGKGEQSSGGAKRPSNLADSMEALIGAAFVDGGIKAADKIFNRVFVPVLEIMEEDFWTDNPKGRLQEICQRRWRRVPRYRILDRIGPEHESVFIIEVDCGDGRIATGKGSNKRDAEIHAAACMLEQLGPQ